MKRTILWQADSIHTNHRIPGMILTREGTQLAYCEAREGISDWSKMEIRLKRSVDGGHTFSPSVILASGNSVHSTVNNPVMVQDRLGTIHFLFCEDYGINNGRILRRVSKDDGKTWSEPLDLTYATLPDYRNAFAIGPGHGICTPNGTLIFPVWMVPKQYGVSLTSHVPSVLATLYSLDNGETWACGDRMETLPELISPNEAEVALLEDGAVYMNFRIMLRSELPIVQAIDLRRKVKLKPRKHYVYKEDNKKIRQGRCYTDYISFVARHPNAMPVQIDTVESKSTGEHKCFLTVHFTAFRFMLVFLLEKKSKENVSAVFRRLTDRGTEFCNPEVIEVDENTGKLLSRVFFCDSYSSYQKGAIEENHELIRYVVTKHTVFDHLRDLFSVRNINILVG